jgi:dTDP-4-dehydrorhamnose 3,5-epimerase
VSESRYQVTAVAPLKEVLLIQCQIFGDSRGFFLESFNKNDFLQATGISTEFLQDNHSRSTKGVLRGIHYQLTPRAQGKLVRVIRGAIFDVAVDLRKSSPTFGRWAGVELRDADGKLLWIPPGFGHAFLSLEDGTDVMYKTTDYYAPDCEASVHWSDPKIGIAWPSLDEKDPALSEKDQRSPTLSQARLFD